MDAIPVSGSHAPRNPAHEEVAEHSFQCGQFSGFQLASLPNELLVNFILPRMAIQDVYACSQVSTLFRDMIQANHVDAISFCRNFCSADTFDNARERYQTIFRPWLHQLGQSGRDAIVKLDKKTVHKRFPQIMFYSIAQALGRAERFAVSQAGTFTETATINKLIYSPDGMHAISNLLVNGVRLYRFVEGKWQSGICISPDSIVEHCGFSADSSRVVTVSTRLRISLHQFVDNRWQEQASIKCPDTLSFAALSGRCQVAVSGNRLVIIYGYDGVQWQQEQKIYCGCERPKVIFSPNGKHVVMASKNLLMYELVDGTWQFQRTLAYAHPGPEARLSANDVSRLMERDNFDANCNDIGIFSADGSCLLIPTWDLKVKIYHLVAGQWQESETFPLKTHMLSASFSQDCHHAMLRLDAGLITFLNCVNGRWQVNTTIKHNSNNMVYSFSPDGVHAMTCCDDKTIRIFQLADGQWQKKSRIEINHEVVYAQFSPCGTHIVVTTDCQDARIYGLVKGRWHMKCCIQGLSYRHRAKFSPTGVYLSTTRKCEVNFWMINAENRKGINSTPSALG